MATDHDAALITRQESWGSAALWFAVLGSPTAWLGHLGIGWALEEVFACSPATSDRGEILGFSSVQVALVLNSVMALIAAAAGLTALALWRRLRHAADGDRLERSQWMAFAGVVEGAIFLVAIVLGYVPPLLLDTCTSSP